MYRTLPYFGLFAAAVLLQVFLFDNLSISVYFNPLVYIVFIALLPAPASRWASRWIASWAPPGSIPSPRC